jgi:hypothetical protein
MSEPLDTSPDGSSRPSIEPRRPPTELVPARSEVSDETSDLRTLPARAWRGVVERLIDASLFILTAGAPLEPDRKDSARARR